MGELPMSARGGAIRVWDYNWYHIPTGNRGLSTMKREMTKHQFLSCLYWWSMGGDWIYSPAGDSSAYLAPHQCANV